MPCSLRAMWYGIRSAYCRSAWPRPATLPCPKMPKQPASSRCSCPSRSLCWLARNSTRACAMVSRRVGLLVIGLLPVRPGAVHPLVPHPGPAAAHLEVVDLLQRRLLRRPLLVVLVGRVGRPVAAGGEHLHGDQLVGLERLRGAEVVHLAAGLAGAAQLHLDALGGAVAGRQPPPRPGGGQGEAAAAVAADLGVRVARQVGEVGDTGEHVGSAPQLQPPAGTGDPAAAGQRQHQQLVRAGVERLRAAGGQLQHAQAAPAPAGLLRRDHQGEGALGRGAPAQVELGAGHPASSRSRPTAVSTAAATSSSGGYSSDRPTTSPRTVGSFSALRQRSNAASWSALTSPPSSSAGRGVAAITRSMSSTTGTFSQA